jgi:multicomponent Na+:H+ antiporter subunit D
MVLIRASLEAGHLLLAVVAALVGLLTVYSMSKIWGEAFWKPLPDSVKRDASGRQQQLSAWLIAPAALLALMTVAIGLWAEPFVAFSMTAAHELLNPEIYVQSVLGGVR